VEHDGLLPADAQVAYRVARLVPEANAVLACRGQQAAVRAELRTFRALVTEPGHAVAEAAVVQHAAFAAVGHGPDAQTQPIVERQAPAPGAKAQGVPRGAEQLPAADRVPQAGGPMELLEAKRSALG